MDFSRRSPLRRAIASRCLAMPCRRFVPVVPMGRCLIAAALGELALLGEPGDAQDDEDAGGRKMRPNARGGSARAARSSLARTGRRKTRSG